HAHHVLELAVVLPRREIAGCLGRASECAGARDPGTERNRRVAIGRRGHRQDEEPQREAEAPMERTSIAGARHRYSTFTEPHDLRSTGVNTHSPTSTLMIGRPTPVLHTSSIESANPL